MQGFSFELRVGGYLTKVNGQGMGFVLSFTYMIGEVKLPAFCCVIGGNVACRGLKRKRLCV